MLFGYIYHTLALPDGAPNYCFYKPSGMPAYYFTEFRLKTAVSAVGIAEPSVITISIEEPVRFSDIPAYGAVDETYHGFWNSYGGEGDLKLEFYCESAHELLSHQYYTAGTDAKVEFQMVRIYRDGSEFIRFDGKVNFEQVVIESGKVSASIIEGGIRRKALDRFDTPVDMSTVYTLDNEAIIPPVVIGLPLPGQTIHEKGEMSRQGLFPYAQQFPYSTILPPGGQPFTYYILPDMIKTAAETAATSDSTAPPAVPALDTLAGVRTIAGTVVERDPFSFPLLVTETAGIHQIDVDWLLRVDVSLVKYRPVIDVTPAAKFGRWALEMYAIIQEPGKPDVKTLMAPRQSGGGEKTFLGTRTLDGHYSAELNLPVGASVHFFVAAPMFVERTKQVDFNLTTLNLRVSIDRKTRAAASSTQAYTLPDALRHTLGAITSAIGHDTGTGRVVGSLIEPASAENAFDGYATEYVVTTGGQMRGLKKAPVYSAQTLMETLGAHHAAGILFERDPETREQQMRVEAGEWFYRGGEIIELTEVFEYREEPDLDLLFNQIEVGYDKFPSAGPGVADEFNTVHTYQTPLVSRDAKLQIKCPLIAAGTAIEEARRLGLKKVDATGAEVSTTSEAGTYDDDGFLLHVASRSLQDTVIFTIVQPQPFPGKPYEAHYITLSGTVTSQLAGGVSLREGDTITFTGTGTPNDGVPYYIIGKATGRDEVLKPKYEVFATSPMVAGGPYPCNWKESDQPVKLRTNERLDVEGIADPETAYNLELSPARMLRRHARFINSGLAYKEVTDELKCTAYKHNGALVTQVKPAAISLPGDSDRQLVREVGNVSLGALERFERLFSPEKIYVTAAMSEEQFDTLIDAMQNRGDEEKRLGYISVLNPDGVMASGYVRKIEYNPVWEVVKLVLRKRKTDEVPGGPTCTDYTDWTYGRFEIDKTANPNLYRFCRFSDFQ